MPDIRIVEPHQLPIDEAKQRLGVFGELLGRYGVKLAWDGSRARLGGVPGVGGDVDIRASEVEVNVKLSRLVTAMGLDPKRLESTIRSKLGEALREPARDA